MNRARVADYDSIAARYDRRYDLHDYAGVRETLLGFIGESRAILEVGCGTGHWLTALTARLKPSRHAAAAGPSRSASTAPALASGVVHRAYTSQLAVLSDEEFTAGVARVREANDAANGTLQLVTDFYLFATVGWV